MFRETHGPSPEEMGIVPTEERRLENGFEGVDKRGLEGLSELQRTVLEQASNIKIRPEDKNQAGELLVNPEGPVSNLDEKNWKIVRTEAFKQWFKDSIVLDENGEPLLTYHGSLDRFNEFDRNKSTKQVDSGFFGIGNYFTPHEDLAKSYGPNLHRVFLSIEKLQIFSENHGNVRFRDLPLPEEIRDEVFRKYEPLRQKELERVKKIDEDNRGSWAYNSSWNGEEDFEHLLSDSIRDVLNEKGISGVFGHNPVSKLYEYVAFNEKDIFIVPEEGSL